MTPPFSTIAVSRRFLLQGAGAVTLAGCSNIIGPPAASQMYLLQPSFGPVASAPSVPWQLVVTVPTAPDSLDTERIALERSANTMDYYANSQWTDRVPLLMQSLLVEAFEKSGRIAAVGRESAGIHADYILQTDIRDFSAHYAVIDTPPKIRIGMGAKLVGALNREVIGSVAFEDEAQAAANNRPNIVAAFSQAAGATIGRIVGWTLQARVPASSATR
jgi:cholesterol transport system auxiliary component